MKNLNQLLLNFDYKQNFKDDDFYVSKSNYYTFNLIKKWPKWEKNFLNISGEKFSGKSHLVNIFLKKFKGIKLNARYLTNDDLKETFETMCHSAGINGINGHRSVGGYRASMYNALPLESVQVLVEIMSELENKA